MHRDLFKALLRWKVSPLRKPLIIRGARQVGKSWLVSAFGEMFDHFIQVDFDKHRQAHFGL